MNLHNRIDLMTRLGEYMVSDDAEWAEVKEKAGRANGWFTPQFIDLSAENIARNFLDRNLLSAFCESYLLPEENSKPKTIGLVMAGNIPMVGFHDLLCIFLSGHYMRIKLSTKDDILIKHLVHKLGEWDQSTHEQISFSEMLKGADAYIATGSNNTARHFDYYFNKYPHIIRRNRTSAAVLTGEESAGELERLSDDVHLYFGLGCRNVTHIFVPEAYDFIPLIQAFKKYAAFFDHNKYKNNFDYQLAIHLLNNQYYMSSGGLLLSESTSLFSPVSQLNYSFYTDLRAVVGQLNGNEDVQCIVGTQFTPFGAAQSPSLTDFADGVDTMKFLMAL